MGRYCSYLLPKKARGSQPNPHLQLIVSITTIFSNITTNGDKAATNGIYMNLVNYPHILRVTTDGNKLTQTCIKVLTTNGYILTTNNATTIYYEKSLQTDTK